MTMYFFTAYISYYLKDVTTSDLVLVFVTWHLQHVKLKKTYKGGNKSYFFSVETEHLIQVADVLCREPPLT